MQDMPIAADDRGFDDWLADTEPHALAHAHAPTETRTRAVQALPDEKAVWVFGLLEPANQADVLHAVDEDERRRLLHEMEPDDRARMLSRLPSEAAEALMRQLTPSKPPHAGAAVKPKQLNPTASRTRQPTSLR